MKIYTKYGDNLKTKTITKIVYKDDIIIEINGVLDELQASIMVAYNFIDNKEIKNILISICKDIFICGYDISSFKQTLTNDKVLSIESLIDKFEKKLKPLTNFIVPGQSKGSSLIHVARTTARRAERVIVSFAKDNNINKILLKYINRLSDLLFILARYIEESPD